MKKKIRILGIAPYEGLRVLMEQAAAERADVDLTAVNGNLEEGRAIAKAMDSEYDVILSRANTAELIRGVTHLPVIDLGISYYDVLRCIRQAKETGTKFAVTGFHNLISIARSLCELMADPIEIFSLDTESDPIEILKAIRNKGYQTIVCDTVPYPHAKLLGLTPILLTTGMENVNAAIDNAVSQYQNQSIHLERIAMLRNVISGTGVFTVVMDNDKKLIYTANNLPDAELIVNKIHLELKTDFPDMAEFFVNVKGNMYSVRCEAHRDAPESYYVCYIKTTEIPMTYAKYGIKVMNRQQAEEEYNVSFYSTTGASRELQGRMKAINQLNGSIMICGERGTGKDKTACLIYARSRVNVKPMYIINCALLNERNWKFLVGSYQSPFMDNDNTIYISNLDALDQDKQLQLLSIMTDTNLHNRNRIIMSCGCVYDQQMPHIAIRIINLLNSFALYLPPMRTQTGDIRAASVLYLDILNQQLGKQVTGLQPDALQMLIDFPWPFNMVQFQRVLKEIIMLAPDQYVTGDIVAEVLEKESKFLLQTQEKAAAGKTGAEADGGYSLDLSRSLGDITVEIVNLVLKEHGGNQSAAAKHLGIGRTTMWRYLNNKE